MNKITFLLIIVVTQVAIAQNKFSKLEKEFKSISLPYESSVDFFPKIGYDALYDVEVDFVPNEGGLTSEITSVFKDNGEYYNSNSRYFSVGKFKFNELTFLIYYVVTKHNSDGHLESMYFMDMYDKTGNWKNSFVIGESNYKLNYTKDPVTANEYTVQTSIKTINGSLVINSNMKRTDYVRTPDEMKVTKTSSNKEIVTIDKLGNQSMVRE